MFKSLKKKFEEAKLHYGIGLTLATEKFTNQFNSLFIDKKFFDDEFFEDLEEKLIEMDITPRLSFLLCDEIQKEIYNEKATRETFDIALRKAIINTVDLDLENELEIKSDILNVLLVIGINGVGKTTSISKLANMYKNNYDTRLVAADTFRAGAIEQLNQWALKLDVPIVKTHEGHPPSAVIYDGISSAKENNNNLLICDTAGRLHNKDNLMQELKKIHSVIESNIDNEFSMKTILVLDGTQGKNTIEQAKAFNEITKIDGIIITKMDSEAKVGMIINISFELKVPIYFVTNGERVEDIKKFDHNLYLDLLFGQYNDN